MRIRHAAAALAFGAAFGLSSCGGGGGDSGAASGSPPAAVGGGASVDLNARWNASETGTSNCQGQATFTAAYEITIVQTGSQLSVTTPSGTFNGTLNGSSVTWSGSYPDNGGTVTISSLNATVSADGNSFSGSANWTWTNGAQSCSGTTNPFSGTRITAGVPKAPSALTASPTSASSIRLTWTDNAGDETGFAVERAALQAGPFTQIGTLGVNATSYDSTGLSASTTYFFRVRARGAAGDSPYSLVAHATTPAALSAPSNLAAAAVSSSAINLSWQDTSSGESGFRIERGTNPGNFAQIAQVGANVLSFASTGLTPGTTYLYRVRAFDATGNSAYSNTAQATTTGPQTFTLNVAKSGVGTGTVSGNGINCGATCTAALASGTTVTLVATAASGSVFSAWTGCDSVTGTSCTVQLNANRTVTAAFGLSTAANITLNVPATSSTGAYTVSWTLSSGLATSTWVVQEAPDTSFSSGIIVFNSIDTASPFELAFSGKADGRYCYRVQSPSTPGVFSAPACVTVARVATAAVLRIVNNTKYDMIDIRLNGTQKVAYPLGILVGQSSDFVFSGAGNVSYNLGVGFYNSDQSRNLFFTLTGTTSVTLGNTTTVTFNNPTIGQLLSAFRASSNWDGFYFDSNTVFHTARFNFSSAGGWTLFDDLALTGTGTVTLVSWPNYASIVTFKICATCANINIAYPFASFQFSNGPPSWPIIEYVWQP